MRYEGKIYRPPSEANSYILQATIGCSWNACTYCDMYRSKKYRLRDLDDVLEDIELARRAHGENIHKIFVADGDALGMEVPRWEKILQACQRAFPKLRRVSAYATAINLRRKSVSELERLRSLGLKLLYIGPESGDDTTLKRIAKGADFASHVRAAEAAHAADIDLSAIFLLGVGGVRRSREHAEASAKLATAMDPRFLSVLTLTVLPGTPVFTLQERQKFQLPSVLQMLSELQMFVSQASPSNAIFRTNHASNYLPLAGRLPRDRERICGILQQALEGICPCDRNGCAPSSLKFPPAEH